MDRTIVIAEAGVNHNGDIALAKQLIDVAAQAGADYVKFQSFKADKLVSRNAEMADYQVTNLNKEADDDNLQYNMLKKLELSHDDHIELIDYCEQKGINFLSTAFDTDGLKYLDNLGLQIFKVPSGELTNFPYLKCLSSIGKPVVLSTGMANMTEIGEALEVLTSEKLLLENITVLHCNTEYPTPMKDVNLMAMLTLKNELKVPVGYSDHTLGIEVPISAVTLGAGVIEKHFTLDRNMEGPDHKASLEPDELVHMIASIRNVEQALSGNGLKTPSESEKKNIHIARKSIHLASDVEAGTILTDEHLIPLRPGDGLSPMRWNQVIGKRATKDLKQGHKLATIDFT